jgi:hypothetical protein
MVAVVAAAALAVVVLFATSEPRNLTNPPPSTVFSCAELASRIRYMSDGLDRWALEREYDRRCPNDPPPTSLAR